MRRGIAIAAVAAVTTIGAALAATVTLGPRRRHGVEPPGGAAHLGGPVRRPDGRLRLPQPGQALDGHHPGERRPGRGSGRRAELVHVLARRSLQPEDRHDGRRPPRRHLPVRVQAQDRPVLPRRHRAAVHGDADREGADDRRRARHDAAEQHRQALDAGLPEPRHEVDRLVRRRRLEGVRRPARRSVLRRHRRHLRPRRHPQGHGERGRRQGLLRRLRRAHVRRPGPDRRRSNAKNGTIGVWALGRPPQGHDPRGDDARARAAGSRSTAWATRSSTR